MTVGGIPVQVVRKSVKNLHIGVYPPDGRVRVCAPASMTEDNIRLAIVSRLSWIKKHRANFEAQPRQSRREMLSGESHYIWGRRHRLEAIERPGRPEVEVPDRHTLRLFVPPGAPVEKRARVLTEWYRGELKAKIPPLLERWEAIVGEAAAEWNVRRMKTKWGSCNVERRRIWLNLELAKKPPECLEYVIVHELVHFLERNHGDRFVAHMDRFMPNWCRCRDILNAEPLDDF